MADLLYIKTHTKGKIMGVDFGDKRTGLALSNESRTMAGGLDTVSPGGLKKTAASVAEIAVRERVSAIVVGLPVNMDGSHGNRAEKCEAFGKCLEELTSLPVVMFDERMTTMAASRFLNETDTRGQKRKQVIDTLSAEIILQNALDRLKYL